MQLNLTETGKPRRKRFSNEDIEFIRNNYKNTPCKRIAEILSRTEYSIYSEIKKLGLRKKIRWNDKEINFLRENYFGKEITDISEELNRTKKSIESKVRKLSLYKKNIDLPPKYQIFNKDLAYIIGVILGDGNINKKNYSVSLSVIDLDFAMEFKNSLERWAPQFNKNIHFYKYTRNNRLLYIIKYCSLPHGRFIKNFIDKRLDDILISEGKIQLNFLKGLYDSEGSVCYSNLNDIKRANRRRHISFYNSDKKIIDMVSNLLKKFKIEHRIYSHYNSGFGSKKKQYTLCIMGISNIKLFSENINFSIKRKRDKLKEIINSYVLNTTYNCLKCGKEIVIKSSTHKYCKTCGINIRNSKRMIRYYSQRVKVIHPIIQNERTNKII